MIDIITICLSNVVNPQYYADERAFQGAFLAEIHRRFDQFGFPPEIIPQQEAQKVMKRHGLRARPDIIIHRPTIEGDDVRRGNEVVLNLKRRASLTRAKESFSELDEIISQLRYRAGFFINIDSSETFSSEYAGKFGERITFIAVQLQGEKVQVKID